LLRPSPAACWAWSPASCTARPDQLAAGRTRPTRQR
jgi:hypothetical protein